MKKKLNHEEYETYLAKERTNFSLERTMLSSERTLLSYIRTAFTVLLFGVAVMKLFELNKEAVIIGIISIVFGVSVLIIGLVKSIKKNKEINKIKKKL